MDKSDKMLLCSVGAGVLINLLLPHLAMSMATEEEMNPPEGAAALDFKGQIMHMLVHHGQVPVTSSLVVALVVCLSVLAGRELCKLMD